MIKIVRYTQEYENVWNEFLNVSKNSTFLFNRGFIEYHSDRFDDFSLLIFDNENIAGLIPANIDSNNIFYSHQGLTYGGFVFRKDETLNNILKYIFSSLRYLNSNKIQLIRYKSFPKFYNTIGSDEIEYALFLLEALLYRRDAALVINLRDRLNYKERRIRGVKKAKKLGIQIIEENTFDDFWNKILIPNLFDRFGILPVHSVDEITLLAKRLPKKIRQFNAYLNGNIIAGTTIFETPSVAHAQYISANKEGRDSGGIDFLFSELIENYFSDKYFFDFGISNENNGKNLNHGLLDWKEGFGGRAYSHDFYEIMTKNYTLLEHTLK